MSRPFVSIIVPCFNEANLIEQCLDSIIANDYNKNRLEVIIVHGLSTDGIREILEYYQHKYPFIRMVA